MTETMYHTEPTQATRDYVAIPRTLKRPQARLKLTWKGNSTSFTEWRHDTELWTCREMCEIEKDRYLKMGQVKSVTIEHRFIEVAY